MFFSFVSAFLSIKFSAFVQHLFLESCGHSLLAFFWRVNYVSCLLLVDLSTSGVFLFEFFFGIFRTGSVPLGDGYRFSIFFCRLTVEFLLDGVTDIIFFISKRNSSLRKCFSVELGQATGAENVSTSAAKWMSVPTMLL